MSVLPRIPHLFFQPAAIPSIEEAAPQGTAPTPLAERAGRARQSQLVDLPKLGHPASDGGPGHTRGVSLKRPVKVAFAERLARRDGGRKSEVPDTQGPVATPPKSDPPAPASGAGHGPGPAKGVSLKRPAKVAFAERRAKRNGGEKSEASDMKAMMEHQTQMMVMSAQMQNKLNETQTYAKLSEAGSKAAKELIQ
ncbi:hypothetical protein [Ralstonia pseudosolanacearum]|uniref:hypothetical protein n=1 Tax=Ralstonia pseudosolanacearum TaxID=1310165 RepID=UPI000AB76D3F|nr:hypothetical protein [Ralstonia pseudosolanacearum]MCL1621857.1 hypothetical protein [Ralstonia pseudosolanacearum CaRs-Mep]